MPVYVPGSTEPKSLARMRKHAVGHANSNVSFTYNSGIDTGVEASLSSISTTLGSIVLSSTNAPNFNPSTPHKMSEFSSMASYVQSQDVAGDKG
mgnify:CR=1 FL=1|jgi:hypothetical protein